MASALVSTSIIHPGETDPIMYQDMVDTIPFSQTEPRLRADVLVKVVLGAINSTLDSRQLSTPVAQY